MDPAASRSSRLEALSHALSELLRHGKIGKSLVEEHELRSLMGKDGYVAISDILRKGRFRGFSYKDVVDCVAGNGKQRFNLDEHRVRIRAQQGHSNDIGWKHMVPDLYLTKITVPTHAIHGTFWKTVEQIKRTGLDPMDRAFVHMTTGLPGHCECEGRNRVDTFLHIDMEAAMDCGYVFYKSGNGVILTRDLPWRFIKRVTDWKGRDIAPRQTIPVNHGRPTEVPLQASSSSWGVPPRQSGSGEASRTAEAMVPAQPKYSQTEKNFLKACKLVREILKLESRTDLVKNQLDKIAKKAEALQEVCAVLDHIDDSDLRQKHEDVIEIAQAHMNVSRQAMDTAEVEDKDQDEDHDEDQDEDQHHSPSHAAVEDTADDESRKPLRGQRGGRSHAWRKAEKRRRLRGERDGAS